MPSRILALLLILPFGAVGGPLTFVDFRPELRGATRETLVEVVTRANEWLLSTNVTVQNVETVVVPLVAQTGDTPLPTVWQEVTAGWATRTCDATTNQGCKNAYEKYYTTYMQVYRVWYRSERSTSLTGVGAVIRLAGAPDEKGDDGKTTANGASTIGVSTLMMIVSLVHGVIIRWA